MTMSNDWDSDSDSDRVPSPTPLLTPPRVASVGEMNLEWPSNLAVDTAMLNCSVPIEQTSTGLTPAMQGLKGDASKLEGDNLTL